MYLSREIYNTIHPDAETHVIKYLKVYIQKIYFQTIP